MAFTLTAALPHAAHATFPGRNGSVVWTEQSGTGIGGARLVALNARTRRERTLWECRDWTPDPALSCQGVSSPAASPDGHLAVVWSRVSYQPGAPPPREFLRVIDEDGSGGRDTEIQAGAFLRGSGDGRRLRFLNNGTTLLGEFFSSGFNLPYVNRLIRPDGALGGQVGPVGAESFDWSVDGRAAYAYDSNIWVADGSTTRQLTFMGGAAPSWSPHATKVAFTRKQDLYVVSSSGGRALRLTRKGGDFPTWSPDGRQIAFVRWRPHRIEPVPGARHGVPYLYALSLRTSKARRLRTDPLPYDREYASPPEWQPLSRP